MLRQGYSSHLRRVLILFYYTFSFLRSASGHGASGEHNSERDGAVDFLLFCEYDANPASLVSVKWRRNGELVRVDRDERLEGGNSEQTALLVKNASRTDMGVYTCELANAIGNDTSDTGIEVNILCEYPCLTIP